MRPLPFFRLDAHRKPTLSLYRSLIRTSSYFQDHVQASFLFHAIRDRFRFHRHDTSPTKTKQLLAEAEHHLDTMRRALQGDSTDQKTIADLAWGKTGRLKEILNKFKKTANPHHRFLLACDTRSCASALKDSHPSYRIPLHPLVLSSHNLCLPSPPPPPKRTSKKNTPSPYTPRKPHQVARVVYDTTGHPFLRIRGYSQPVQVSMMVKKRVRTAQQRTDRYQTLLEQLDMVTREAAMLRNLGFDEDTEEWVAPIKEAIALNKPENPRLKKTMEEEDFDV